MKPTIRTRPSTTLAAKMLLMALFALAPLCVCRPAQAQSPNDGPATFDPTLAPYNADKSGASDAAAAINQAAGDAVAWGNANNAAVVVSLPAGKYLLQSSSINISYAQNNVTFTGHSSGDTFLLYTKAQNTVTYPFGDSNAAHTVTVTFQNFTEDAGDPSQFGYTQGTITAIDPATNSATLQVEPGYPLLNRPDFASDATQGFNDTFSSSLYTFSDPKRPIWDHPQGLMQSLAPSADGTSAVVTMMQYFKLPSFVHVGSRFAILDTPTHVANTLILDDNVTYSNVNYYGGLDMEADGASEYIHGNLTFQNFYQGPPPTPAQATATRPATFLPDRLVTAEEGFQLEAYGTTSFINCDLSGGWDDVLDLGGGFAKVLDRPSGTQTTQVHTDGCRFFQPGDIIELSRGDSTGTVYVPSDQITGVQTQTDGSDILTLQTAIPSASVQVGDFCTDRSCAGPIVLQNSSFSSMNGHVFLKSGGLTDPSISVTGCTLHDMSDNGLEVVGAPSYEQGPLEARNVVIRNNLFENCQNVGCLIQEGTAVTGSNVQILGNTFLDTGSETFESSTGPAIVLDNVNGATVSGNRFDRNWGANVCAEYDANLTITGNTFNHPNFIRPNLAAAYTGRPESGNAWIVPDPSSVVFLSNDTGVTLSGNLVDGAGPYTKYLVEVDTGVTNASGLTDGVYQIDNPLAFYLPYDKFVIDQPPTGSVLDQAAWANRFNQKWIAAPTSVAPGFATLTDYGNGKYVGNGTSASAGASIVLEPQAWASGTANPAAEQLWDFAAVTSAAVNLDNAYSGYAVAVQNAATVAGTPLIQAAIGNAPDQDVTVVAPPALTVRAGFENVILQWAPVPGATGYNIGRATVSGGPYTVLAMKQSATAYTDTAVTPGTVYYYVVDAAEPISGDRSNQVAAVPSTKQTDVPVNLAPGFNTVGIEPNAWSYLGPGFDGSGDTYSSSLVPTIVTWNGDVFSLGSPAGLDAVSDSGQRIVLPAGNFSTLSFLGGYVGGTSGSTATFSPTLTYADGTSVVLSQSMTNWLGSAGQSGESNAVTASYRNLSTGKKQTLTNYVHGYQIPLDPTRQVQWLDLPSTGRFRLLAMNLDNAASVMSPGRSLQQGQYLTSPTGKCYLTQQVDGNLVLYTGSGPANKGAVLWASNAFASGGIFYTIMQTDGNLVTYQGTPAAPGGAIWASATYSNQYGYLQLTDSGHAQVLQSGASVWDNGVNMQASTLAQGRFLNVGEDLTSPQGGYYLTQLSSGDLALYAGTPASPGAPVWDSGATGSGDAFYTVMQTDGNLVTYQGTPGVTPQTAQYAVWNSATYGNPGSYLTLTDAPEVQVINNGNVLWQKP